NLLQPSLFCFEKNANENDHDPVDVDNPDSNELHIETQSSDDEEEERRILFDDNYEDMSPPTTPEFGIPETYTMNDFQKHYALFLLELREEHLLPLHVINSITCNVVHLLDIVWKLLSQKSDKNDILAPAATSIHSCAGPSVRLDVAKNVIDEIISHVQSTTKSEYHFNKLCENFFGYLSPTEILLSAPPATQSAPTTLNRSSQDFAYYVPIRESLRRILAKEEMIPLLIDNIQQQQQQTKKDDDLMFSYRDAQNGRNVNSNSFLLQLYTDGVGLTNPIGPKKDMHKVTFYYYLLEDIPDIFRSLLQCITLLAMINTDYLENKDYCHRFYESLIKDLNDLQQHGLRFDTFNSQLMFTFTCVSSDNLAAHQIGNFQQTFSSGYFCRRCLVHYDQRTMSLFNIEFPQRNATEHQQHVQQTIQNNDDLPVFGVKGPSVLQQLDNYSPIRSLPGDAMHDFAEGTIPMIIVSMLKELSRKRLMTYAQIEHRTANFNYGTNDKSDKPPSVKAKHLQNDRLVGSASQKILFFRLFPLIFHDVATQLDTFKLYSILREMLEIVLALPLRKSWLPYLNTLSKQFQSLLKEILPDKMRPKVHFCTEYSTIIRDFGPSTRYWCIRYEGRHLYFKKIALRTCNFKNITKTLTTRNQYRHCLSLSRSYFLKSFTEASGSKLEKLVNYDINIKELLNQKFRMDYSSQSTILE
ncbi:unnamed protein product, partial [Didymodactylos carnosus]